MDRKIETNFLVSNPKEESYRDGPVVTWDDDDPVMVEEGVPTGCSIFRGPKVEEDEMEEEASGPWDTDDPVSSILCIVKREIHENVFRRVC